MANILISLGSNKTSLSTHNLSGNSSRAEIVLRAARSLLMLGRASKLSSLYRSVAWPDPAAPAYVNAVMAMQTALSPREVLGALLAVEAGFSRIRSDDPVLRYAPRTLDLDLLDFEGVQMETEELCLPHPRMTQRAFVMAPLVEVAPDWQHPVTKEEAMQLLSKCDMAGVARFPWVG